jgi:hypothetical protein
VPEEDRYELRQGLFAGLVPHAPLVVHDTDSEPYMLKLCEDLWPCERVRKLRQLVEAGQTA